MADRNRYWCPRRCGVWTARALNRARDRFYADPSGCLPDDVELASAECPRCGKCLLPIPECWHDLVPIELVRVGDSVVGLGVVTSVERDAEQGDTYEVRVDRIGALGTAAWEATGREPHRDPLVCIDAGAMVGVLRRDEDEDG